MMSGYLLALLNAGLVLGLVISGWLAAASGSPAAGIITFTVLAFIPAAAGFSLKDPDRHKDTSYTYDFGFVRTLVSDYRWLWLSSVIIVGITGIATSLYPTFSGLASDILGLWIAGMSIATILAVLLISRLSFAPVKTIRWAAVLMAFGILTTFYTPLGFLVLGAVAGVVMISQMLFLSEIKEHPGIVMGIFSTTSYLGMALLPFVAGLIADAAGFFAAFCAAALMALVVFVTIGRCSLCTGN
jgi:MFS family permease